MSGAAGTPLMRQWRDAKSQHPDALVFFRVGDFFELFNEDAEEGARLLGLTLTSRNNGAASRVPLAGVPAKALDDYLAKLVRVGRRVAICDQVEDPAEAKGIVRREVVETITPGTVLQDTLLSSRRNTFLVAISPGSPSTSAESEEPCHGIAALDLSTGELRAELVESSRLVDELGRLEAAEILTPRSMGWGGALGVPNVEVTAPVTERDDWIFDPEVAEDELKRSYRVASLDGFDLSTDDSAIVSACGALLTYVHEVRPGGVGHLRAPRVVRPGASMALDDMTRRNLELVEPLRSGETGGTLLSVLDDAVTPMGARMLRQWVLHPLVDAEEIWERQAGVETLFENRSLRVDVREELRSIDDLERLAGKVGTQRVSPRELASLRRSLSRIPSVREHLANIEGEGVLTTLRERLDPMPDVRSLLEEAVSDEPPAALQDGGVIRMGWSEELDELRSLRDGARDFIAQLQARERERTGITSLKVGFNKVFGYYLEVTRANLDRVPEEYHRKQTLANAERYFTPELKEWEERVTDAEGRILALETELFAAVRARLAAHVGQLADSARDVATLDVIGALAEVAARRGYVRPEVHTGIDLTIRRGRHPVVETMLATGDFIPNDSVLHEDGRVVILTGPNMAGKSTVLRQIGLIQLLAQIGSYVPADEAQLPVTDRIFTRVGASDNLARGQSTFMVEMSETAAILNSATERSLVLLDEIGRGTSTYDGVSIAWAVTEHLHEVVGAKVIFATHYHELTQLGDLLPAARNWNVAVKESGDEIVFLRTLKEGGADRSYGIQVGRLAGIPDGVIGRAKEILVELEGAHSAGGEGLGRHGRLRPASEPPPDQLTFFGRPDHPVVDRLRELDPDQLTPIEALNLLAVLRDEARED